MLWSIDVGYVALHNYFQMRFRVVPGRFQSKKIYDFHHFLLTIISHPQFQCNLTVFHKDERVMECINTAIRLIEGSIAMVAVGLGRNNTEMSFRSFENK